MTLNGYNGQTKSLRIRLQCEALVGYIPDQPKRTVITIKNHIYECTTYIYT